MTKTFSAWKVGIPYYLPGLLTGAILALLFRNSAWVWTSVPFFLFGGFALFFFRDPPRVTSPDSHDIVAPADGRILAIDELESSPYYRGPCKRIAIFMSVFNVHVNRAPVSGAVYRIEHKPGKFLPAMKREATDVNEANTLYMDSDHGRVTVRQISGILARRIVCIAEEGNELEQGQKFGMIRFGSRAELYLPPDAVPCVKLKQKVKAGLSTVARFQ
ncbi:MAG TPA: phosphatidylserine decarboxylase family protein [Candidatus Hydrogenedentes bacterium]|nr:phosphatidylserine decarboxylase family protein [Candidatus Hydrogenedentota bacterium]HQE84257.1 phosphatidylserine decarboxylase family protein [Candidatus Hydrogenedentota bacterium]HQH51273.1 phosphatidylserine decarboxylase family protein [Candidatus Hydrogenedentota bacterium]HQM50580.1 phosphatidylserine decarboxylase family protein [Candidatus Hydrogenedentota bacterium]